MTTRTYHVTNPIAFRALSFALPANSLVFWSRGQAGGVLLIPDVHYLAASGQMTLAIDVSAGDLIQIVTLA